MDIIYKLRQPKEFKASAKEVVKELNGKPHLLVRIQVSGDHFPHRAAHPFVMIRTGDRQYFKDLFTEVAADNSSLIGYLPVHIPPRGEIAFGYGDTIWGFVPGTFTAQEVSRLDRQKLPKDIVVVDEEFLKDMK